MNYMLVEKFRLFISLLWTKLFFRNAKLVRFPSVFRGKKYFYYGFGLVTGYNCRFDVFSHHSDGGYVLKVGNNVQFNDNVHIAACKEIVIGDNVLVASRVFITDHNHGSFPFEDEFELNVSKRKLSFSPVIIEDNVWLGESVCVMSGVKIGENSIIGAGAVVTKSIPKNSIAVGNPAKVIKTYCHETKEWREVN